MSDEQRVWIALALAKRLFMLPLHYAMEGVRFDATNKSNIFESREALDLCVAECRAKDPSVVLEAHPDGRGWTIRATEKPKRPPRQRPSRKKPKPKPPSLAVDAWVRVEVDGHQRAGYLVRRSKRKGRAWLVAVLDGPEVWRLPQDLVVIDGPNCL